MSNSVKSFPWHLLPLLRCPVDGGVLSRDQGERACCACGFQSEPVQSDGILDLCLDAPEHPEAQRELQLRDDISDREAEIPALTALDRAEMVPTIAALHLKPTDILLELGCGQGRYTVAVLDKCAGIVAVDFSRGVLSELSSRLPMDANVALVRADIAKLRTATAAFPVVLSQLTSNLPTAELRDCMYRVSANALTKNGRFVFGAHYWGLTARREGLVKDGYYSGKSKIYRYYMTADEVRTEASRFFDSVATQPVAVTLPGSYKLRLPLRSVSRICERIPVLRDFGTNLLCVVRNARAQSACFLWMGFEGFNAWVADVTTSLLDSQAVWSQLL